MNIGNQSCKNALRQSSAIASLPSWRYFSSDNEMLFPFIEHLSCIRQPIYNNDEIGSVLILIFPMRKLRLKKRRRNRGKRRKGCRRRKNGERRKLAHSHIMSWWYNHLALEHELGPSCLLYTIFFYYHLSL